jgi:predicted outer membrane repeat protein
MNDNDKRNNVGRANTSFSRTATPSGVPSTFASRRSAARAVAAVASTGLLVGMGAVGVGPALAAPAPAVTDCNVRNTVIAPEPAADIQAILTRAPANPGEPVIVCLSGTFTLTTPLTFNHDLTLIGLTDSTILDGGGVTRILVGIGNTTLTVSNLEFRAGLAAFETDAFGISDEGLGGAILTEGRVSIFGSEFSRNLGGKGGGAISASGTVDIYDSTFVDNAVDDLGGYAGGAVSAGGAITVSNSTFLRNVATGQGGAISSGARVTVTNSAFTSNQAQTDGGAIFADSYVGGVTPSTGSTFTDNTADSDRDDFGHGGAIYVNDSISVNGYTFSANTAADGGALYSGSTVNTENSTFFANTTTDEGGAIYTRGGSVAFSTFFNNQAADRQGTQDIPGQAIHLEASSGSVLPIEGSIFVGRPVESQLGVGGGPASTFNNVGGNVFSTASDQEPNLPAALPAAASTMFAQSALALFGTTTPVLAPNRGTTQTLALVSGSPAIDAARTSSGVLSDQRGLLRPGLGSTRADAGAFEFQAATPGQVNGLTATGGNSSVALSWSAASNDGDSPITDYVIEQNSGSGWVRVVDGVSTATSFTVTGLTNGTSYQFRVSAVNAVGSGVVSAASASVTPTAPTAPTAPAVLAATGSSPAAGWLAGGAALLMALGSTLMVLKRRRFR